MDPSTSGVETKSSEFLLFDSQKALQAFGSETILKQAMAEFFGHSEVMLAELSTVIASADRVKIREKIHWFRGGTAYLFSPLVLAKCQELKQLASQEPLPGLEAAVQKLSQALAQLHKHIDQLYPA